MKSWAVAGCVLFMSIIALGVDPQQPAPYVAIWAPYVAKTNEPFTIQVWLVSPSNLPVTVEVESSPVVTFSETRFQLRGSERKRLTMTMKSSPPSGLVWINAWANNGYEVGGWNAVDVGFQGRLKPTWTESLSYDAPTTLSLTIVDNDGKPIPFEGDLELKLDSADGILNGSKEPMVLKINPAARATPQFQLRPRYVKGGTVHLAGILTVADSPHVLAQEQFTFAAQPAWWIPVVLAMGGGLLHAVYKIVRAPQGWPAIIVISSIAGVIGYLFADFDLLGLKLDSNVLRTYPILGFLFSYFGIEGLFSNKFARPRTSTTEAPPVPGRQVEGSGAPKEQEPSFSHVGADKTKAQSA